ncbi:MAG: tetratricopeptide repeat protein [Acidobacteriaceae bacterium]|nr:tetratricopeptide repeat protein [Acidobacteriaceae bacterium]
MRCFLLFAVALIAPVLLAAAQDSHISPADMRIAAAQKRVETNSKSWQPYNDLAAALCRKARDREDVALYDQAQAALDRSLLLSPGNYDAEKLRVTVLLGKHHLSEALDLAAQLNHKVPDDIGGWGLLVDAQIALGNYSEAERAAQWMLDLRPGSALGFVKAAGLRELFGDGEGAIEFYDEANRRTSQNDADERAWLLTQNARIQLVAGNLAQAEALLAQALKLFPDSQLAIAVLSQVRMRQGNYSDAATLLEKRYRAIETPANLYDWAEALEKSGQKEKAAGAFKEFEANARAQMAAPYNANLQLIYFYTDHESNPTEALALATKESTIRHDCRTLDAYAWALYSNGKYGEATEQMNRALAVGVRDADYFCHAAKIAAKANDAAAASRYEKELASFPANSCALGQPTQSARRERMQ